jgi:hypothetical protein
MRSPSCVLIGVSVAACGGGGDAPGAPDEAVVDGASAPDAYTGPAVLDPHFGEGGIAMVEIDGGRDARFHVVGIQANGSVALTGEAFFGSWQPTTCHLHGDGALDVEWGTGGCVQGLGGRALLPVGDELLVSETVRAALWRYDATGKPVASFGDGGLMDDFLPSALAIYAIVAAPDGGWFVAAPETERHAFVAKVSDAPAVVDSTLSSQFSDYPRLVSGAILGDGTLLLGGRLGEPGVAGGVLMRFSSDLEPDTRWTDGFLTGTDDVQRVAARPAGGFWVFTRSDIRRFTDDGELDGSFGDAGVRTTVSGELLRSAVVLADGRFVTATVRRPAGGAKNARETVVRVYGDDGTFDPYVGVGGALVLPIDSEEDIVVVEDATVDPDGNVVLTGVDGETSPRPWVARLLAGE